jgi:hypothetical protein
MPGTSQFLFASVFLFFFFFLVRFGVCVLYLLAKRLGHPPPLVDSRALAGSARDVDLFRVVLFDSVERIHVRLAGA